MVIGTRYFWERWAPRLGPTLTVLVVHLRRHCYYNQTTKERRDWCFPTQQTLAEEAGVSRWTVMRELKKPIAREFVRVQLRSRYDPVRRQTVRISSLYHVAMDDPLVEEDRGRAAAILAAGTLLEEAEGRHDTHCGLIDPGRETEERPFTGQAAKALVANLGLRMVQTATGPDESKLPQEDEPEEVLSNDVAAVARELIEEQVTPGIARKLARDYPAERIRDKMTLVKQLKSQHELRNPAGFLRRAIEEDYGTRLAATGTEDRVPLLELRTPPVLAASLPPFTAGTATNGDVWEATKRVLSSELRPAVFVQWLEPSRLLCHAPGQLTIVVPDARIQRYIEQRLKSDIERALTVSCGTPTNLQVVVEGESRNV
ncbi:MAG TPA: DnaA N-terminal domain-containing protein [Chloroflexota bacterium]|nr:DnaA N-terminal domain-containing protein [Chloroflexota bacterium]